MANVKFGGAELVAELENYLEETRKWAERGIAKVTTTIHNHAKALAPVDDGFLRESITMDISSDGLTGRIDVGASYAIFVEFGTGIYATGTGGSHAKKIPWSYEKDGRWYTTKGQRPQPFWQPAIDAGRSEFNRYFR